MTRAERQQAIDKARLAADAARRIADGATDRSAQALRDLANAVDELADVSESHERVYARVAQLVRQVRAHTVAVLAVSDGLEHVELE